jgi:hypothetical protein
MCWTLESKSFIYSTTNRAISLDTTTLTFWNQVLLQRRVLEVKTSTKSKGGIWNFYFYKGCCHFAHLITLHPFSIVCLSFIFIPSLISFPSSMWSTCYPFPILSYYFSSPISPFSILMFIVYTNLPHLICGPQPHRVIASSQMNHVWYNC